MVFPLGFPSGSEGRNPSVILESEFNPGMKNPLEEKLTAHSSILAWSPSETEEPSGFAESDRTGGYATAHYFL